MEAWRKQILAIAEEKNISVPQLAKKAGVDKTTLYQILFPEKVSKGGNPSVKWLEKVAAALDCELEVNFVKNVT